MNSLLLVIIFSLKMDDNFGEYLIIYSDSRQLLSHRTSILWVPLTRSTINANQKF